MVFDIRFSYAKLMKKKSKSVIALYILFVSLDKKLQ